VVPADMQVRRAGQKLAQTHPDLLYCSLQIRSNVARVELTHSPYDTDCKARTVHICEAAVLCAAGVTCACMLRSGSVHTALQTLSTPPHNHLPQQSPPAHDKRTCAAGSIKVFTKVFHEEDTPTCAHIGRVRNHRVERVQVVLQLLASGRPCLVRTFLEHGPTLDCICLAEIQHNVRLAPVPARAASLLMVACTSTTQVTMARTPGTYIHEDADD
jgi:hypothetical protein